MTEKLYDFKGLKLNKEAYEAVSKQKVPDDGAPEASAKIIPLPVPETDYVDDIVRLHQQVAAGDLLALQRYIVLWREQVALCGRSDALPAGVTDRLARLENDLANLLTFVQRQ